MTLKELIKHLIYIYIHSLRNKKAMDQELDLENIYNREDV